MIDTDIATVLELLKGTSAGQYYFNLISAKKISVIYDDFSKYPVSDLTLAFWGERCAIPFMSIKN